MSVDTSHSHHHSHHHASTKKKSAKHVLSQLKKYIKKHMPTFVQAWHMKVDLHLFRYIFVGLVIVGFVVALFSAYSINYFARNTVDTRASDDVQQPKLTAKQIAGDRWEVRATGRTDDTWYSGYYVGFGERTKEDIRANVTNFENIWLKDIGGPLTSDGSVARWVGQGFSSTDPNTRGVYIPSSGEGQLLFVLKGEKPTIDKAFLYAFQVDNPGNPTDVTQFEEQRLEVAYREMGEEGGDPQPTSVPEPTNDPFRGEHPNRCVHNLTWWDANGREIPDQQGHCVCVQTEDDSTSHVIQADENQCINQVKVDGGGADYNNPEDPAEGNEDVFTGDVACPVSPNDEIACHSSLLPCGCNGESGSDPADNCGSCKSELGDEYNRCWGGYCARKK